MEKAGPVLLQEEKNNRGTPVQYCTGTFYRLQISTTDLFTGTGTVQYRYHRYNILSRYSTSTVPVKRHRGSYRETWSRRLRFI